MCGMMIGLLGAVVSAAGSIAQGQQQQKLAEYQAKAYEQQAEADAKASGFEMLQERRRQDLLQANARAQVGASGVAFQGSPTAVMTANAGQGQLDLMAIQYGSQLRQGQLNTQASISRYEGAQAKTAGFINAASGFISGISQLYNPSSSVQLGTSIFGT